jgi:phosphoribulokinase
MAEIISKNRELEPAAEMPDPKNAAAYSILENVVRKLACAYPLVIGITGAGGAGKTTFGHFIMLYYGHENCASIDLDDYLISREERGRLGMTGYNPKANQLSLARRHLLELKNGRTISKPRYNHNTGKVMENETVAPKKLIIIEGVSTLYDTIAELNDFSFFLEATEKTQIKSRIMRDVNERGYTKREAILLYKNLKPEYKRFIEPTKAKASVIFKVTPDYVMHPIHIDARYENVCRD